MRSSRWVAFGYAARAAAGKVSSIALVSLSEWLTPLPNAEQMRAIDRWAIEHQGVPSLELMERAGEGVARVVEEVAPDGPVSVVCGKGNNGGDGLVVARLLRDAGRVVTVLSTAPSEALSADAAANLTRLPGAPPRMLTEGVSVLAESAVIVDALLGTGFEGRPRGTTAEGITAIGMGRHDT